MAACVLRLSAVLLWSLPAAQSFFSHAIPEWPFSDPRASRSMAEKQACIEEATREDPFHSCLCQKWERYYQKLYPDVDYSACELLYNDAEVGAKFMEWLRTYKKTYTDYNEQRLRFATFAANFVYVQFRNRSTNDFFLDVNEFADQTPEEFHSTHLGLGSKNPMGEHLGSFSANSNGLPESVDWVADGAVNPPRDQGSASSCWSFTAAHAIEGGWAKRTGVLVELSPQQFIDCTGSWLSAETGGDLKTPIQNVAVGHDLCSDESYPYTKRDDPCKQDETDHCSIRIPKGAVTGYLDVSSNNEEALMAALYLSGPVSVGIDAMGNELMFYSSGVLTAPCSANLNHAVVTVGYGMQGHLPYWKVKNSWGHWWGEDGFFRLVRGQAGAGQCGIKVMPTVPAFTEDEEILGMARNLSAGDQSGMARLRDRVAETEDTSEEGGGLPPMLEEILETIEANWALCAQVIAVALGCCTFGCVCGSCCCPREKRRGRGADLGEESEDEECGGSSDSEDEERVAPEREVAQAEARV